jgi:hypothetical protein
MAKNPKTFNVMAKLNLECGIDIKAESLEEAVEKARDLTESDFVEILGNYNDGSIEIFGLFENS